MSQKIYTNLDIKGNATIGDIINATSDTDKFLVSDDGVVKYRTGSEMLSDLGVAPGVASNVQHQVKAGVSINKGQAVYVTSADGTNMIVGLASNASEATSSKTMGLLDNTVAVNGFANVVTEGLLSGLNTIGAAAGDPVWLGTNGNLIYGLANKPSAPDHLVFIGIVTRVNANNGEIFVKVQNGFELNEIHDVDLKSSTPIGNQILAFEGAPVNLWRNKTIPSVLGYTPVPTSRTITINGNTQDLSANLSFSIASGVTSFNTRTGAITLTTGDVTGALGYTPYNASNPAGYISSYTETDPTVPSHVKAITTTNISNWNTAFGWGNHASAGYVPGARTITINGTTQDLSANRSFTVSSTVNSGFSLVNQGTASNTPSSPTANMGVFVDTYAFIDLSTAHPDGGWIDFSKANGTDYAGRIRYNNTSEYFSIAAGSNEQVRIFNSNAEALGSFRAPIFYDSNNTGFYFDGASGTNLQYLNVNGAWNSSPFGPGQAQLNVNGTYPSITQRQTDLAQGYWLHHVDSAGCYNLYGGRGATNGVDWNWSIRAFPNQDGSRVEIRTDLRAPIFYDLDNTAYYMNPASTSVVNNVSAAGYIYSSTYIESAGAVYGTIFYDNNNRSYYVDPSSTSVLNQIQFGTSSNGGRFTGDNSWGAKFFTSDGYIWFGPANGGHAHIYTDRPNFYLNAPITVNGSSIMNTNDIRAAVFYDANDTGYYADFNSSADNAVRQRGGTLHGPNPTWGAYLLVGGDGRQNYINSGVASVCASNGNLHMDAGSGYEMYLNYYDGSVINFGGGSNNVVGRMDASGNIVFAGDVTAFGSPSDIRLKTIKEKIPNALSSILKLNGYRFDWKEEGDILNIKEDIGVIAQEVAEVLPELTRTNDNGFMSVRHQGLTAVLIEAIKEQQTQIEELKELVNKLINK